MLYGSTRKRMRETEEWNEKGEHILGSQSQSQKTDSKQNPQSVTSSSGHDCSSHPEEKIKQKGRMKRRSRRKIRGNNGRRQIKEGDKKEEKKNKEMTSRQTSR